MGAYALAWYGLPRYTGDIDVLVRPSLENARRLELAIRDFGFASLGLSAADFTEEYQVIQIGHPPNRIDLLTRLTGISFDEASAAHEAGEIDGIPVRFIGKEAFLRNKRATGRLKDLADAEALEKA